MGGPYCEKAAQGRTGARLPGKSNSWWEQNPENYDRHRTIVLPEGTPEFFETIDRRFFTFSLFYRGSTPFERLIPFGELRGKRVLEIGCGLGTHAQLLSQAGCHLTTIDLTMRAVELTRRRLSLNGLRADVRLMDAERMEFQEGGFGTKERVGAYSRDWVQWLVEV